MQATLKTQRNVIIWLMIALLLRLAVAVMLYPEPVNYAYTSSSGGDTFWYISNGYALFSGQTAGTMYGVNFDISMIPTAPLYLVFVGFLQVIFGAESIGAVLAIWLIQSLTGTAVCWFAYRIVCHLADERAGLWALIIFAVSPALAIEASQILSESLYLFFVYGGLWWTSTRLLNERISTAQQAIVAGLWFGLATLTRAVFLLFPVGVMILLVMRWRGRAVRMIVALLIAYCATVGTWTTYNVMAHDRLVIGSSELMGAVWRGATEQDADPQTNDDLLDGEDPAAQAAEIIADDPAGFVTRRIRELISSYLQPHGTITLGGESLRDAVAAFWQSDRTAAGLWAIITADNFISKSLIYLFQFGGFLLAIAGIWFSRRRWPIALLLLGFVAYTTLLHLGVLALPRYVFPAVTIFWLFSAVTIARLNRR